MTQRSTIPATAFNRLLVPRVVTGALVALIFITFFLYGFHNADPAWGRYWMWRPFVVVTLAGAGGGLFSFLIEHLAARKGWNKWVVRIVSLLVYLTGLFFGFVLGLDGTLWD